MAQSNEDNQGGDVALPPQRSLDLELIDKQASIVWSCYPNFDSDPICCTLLKSEARNPSFGELGSALDGATQTVDGALQMRVHPFFSNMGWAPGDRLAVTGCHLGLSYRESYWSVRVETIHAEICTRAWHEEWVNFVSAFGGQHLGASLLLMAEFQLLKPDDPRFIGTIQTIEKKLRRGDFVLRYDEEDDFGRPEVAFLVCTFCWILALAAIGQKDRGCGLFESVPSKCNHLGFLAEDVAPGSGVLRGNFPQIYRMVGLIQCAPRLSIPWN